MATTTALIRTPTSASTSTTPSTSALIHAPTSRTTTAQIRAPTARPTAPASASSSGVHPPLVLPRYPPSPGTWRHPKLTEIARRQSAATFSDLNLRRAILNALTFLLSFYFTSSIHTATDYTASFLPILEPSTTTFYTINTIRLSLLYNLAYALWPLLPAYFPDLKSKDDITDIPLTPSQRYLLGLDPSVPSKLPDTPKSASADSSPYITPPRYRRSSSSSFSYNNASSSSSLLNSPVTDRRSISATYYSSSPLAASSRNFSPASALSPFRSPSRGNNGSPYSPSASPLLHKAIAAKNNNNANNGREVTNLDRRRSLGTPASSLGRSQSVRERGAKAGGDAEAGTDSPSPSSRSRRNPHLNYKWLYEKSARLPKSETMQF